MRILQRLLVPILLAGLLPACATLTTGTNQTITVITEPTGAVCQLRRSGEVVGIVNPTPGTIQVSKSSREIQISCTRAGHGEGVGTLAPEFQAMTLGNILIGGLIGIVVDASSGAVAQYPSTVTIALAPGVPLPPNELQQLNDRIEALRSGCAPVERARCNAEIRTLERQRTRLTTPTS